MQSQVRSIFFHAKSLNITGHERVEVILPVYINKLVVVHKTEATYTFLNKILLNVAS